MNSTVHLATDDIGVSLRDCARKARHRLTIAAPYIKRKALERVLDGIAPSVTLTVFTRWSVGDIAAGVSDLNVLDLVRGRHDSRLLLHPHLHAKVLVIDDEEAAIGSANVTDAALGFAAQPNAEATVILRPVPNRFYMFLLQLERGAVLATEELRLKFEEAAKAVPPPWTPPVVDLTGDTALGPPTIFPCFRNPQMLYRGYVSVADFSDQETRAAILDDLDALSIPEGFDEEAFRRQVGASLLTREIIAAFDDYVSQPRFFGDMANWLKARGVLAAHSQEDRNLYLQTLIRWLRYFLPGRYRLEEPNYSEFFGRAEGWKD